MPSYVSVLTFYTRNLYVVKIGKIIESLKSVVRFIIVEKQNIKFLQILISQILYAVLYLNISIYVYFIRTSIF